MRNFRFWAILLAPAFLLASQFDSYFTNQTMRLDFYRTGAHDEEIFSTDEIVVEPVWAGSKTNLIDTLNLGYHLFKVCDAATGKLLYSQGFSSIFQEWQSTDEAIAGNRRSFHESVRFPNPRQPVELCFFDRDSVNRFTKVWSLKIDPKFANIRRNRFNADAKIIDLMNNGPVNEKVDLLILGDGYTKKEMKKFRKDAERLTDVLFSISPFKERKADFNVRIIAMPSNDSGIDDPRKGIYKDNALSSSFNSFTSDRYVLTFDNKTVRKIASAAPYDHLYILLNSAKYGGGGIYNLYSTCVSDNVWSAYIFCHEFGHSFGGLGDEYYTSNTAYTDFFKPGVEPWEPNVTAMLDSGHVKWQDQIEPGTPIPTPWGKAEMDSETTVYTKYRVEWINAGMPNEKLDSLSVAHEEWVVPYLKKQTYANKVGVFEGSGYMSEGLYRPAVNCIMFSRTMAGYCPVCRRAIERVIDHYVK